MGVARSCASKQPDYLSEGWPLPAAVRAPKPQRSYQAALTQICIFLFRIFFLKTLKTQKAFEAFYLSLSTPFPHSFLTEPCETI